VADNVSISTVPWATRSVAYSGDAGQNVQVVGLVCFTGADDAKTAIDIPGTLANGVLVDVSRVQGTVPVSGPLTDTQLRASAVPVSGAFFQATQPISAASLPLPTGAALEAGGNLAAIAAAVRAEDTASADADKGIGALAVRKAAPANTSGADGDYEYLQISAGRLWASATIDAALPAGANVIGAVTQSGTWNVGTVTTVTTVTAVTAITNALPAGGNNIGSVNVATLPALAAGTNRIGAIRPVDSGDNDLTAAKGSQPAGRYLAVQDAKDTGRQQVMLSWDEMAGTAGVESTLTNFTLGSENGVNLTAATNYTVPAGKTLHIQEITCYVKTTSTVNNLARFRLRQAAAILNTSPVIFNKLLALQQNGTYLAGELIAVPFQIPDGLEVSTGQKIAFTWFTAANTCTVGMSLTGYLY
jgi:hypothetical protein